VLQGVLGLAISVAIARAMYSLVERPFARLRRRFGPAEPSARPELREAAA
jgi:peptidoglycan/LPS O-acetylase OafA/YrhL